MSSEEIGEAFSGFLRLGKEIENHAINLLSPHMNACHPAFLAAIHVAVTGGTIGLLTARGNRAGHEVLIRELEDFLCCRIPVQEIYFISDQTLNHRLRNHSSIAQKKLQVCLDHLNGCKIDASGNPQTMPARFRRVILIDDEDSNIQAVHYYIAEQCLSEKLRARGIFHTSDTIRHMIRSRVDKARARGKDPSQIWRRYRKELRKMQGEESLGSRLIVRDARLLSGEDLYRKLVNTLRHEEIPQESGTLLLLDIDGTLVTLDSMIYVRDRRNPEGTPLVTISQREWADRPEEASWIAAAAAAHQLDSASLFVDFKDFNDPENLGREIRRKGSDMFLRE